MWHGEPIGVDIREFWAFLIFLEIPDEDLHDLHRPCMNCMCFPDLLGFGFQLATNLHVHFEISYEIQMRARLGFKYQNTVVLIEARARFKFAPGSILAERHFKLPCLFLLFHHYFMLGSFLISNFSINFKKSFKIEKCAK